MADPARRHPANAPGPWFVDASCINCDVSRQCAPWMFGEADDQAIVVRQPAGADEEKDAMRALLACPTASIGVAGAKPSADGLFPELLEDGVFYCGYTSRDSYGANAYFVQRPEGNLLVDSPRFVPPLVRAFEAQGGIAMILLTHQDDVADADRFAEHFSARVFIHEDDGRAAPYATDLIRGADAVELRPNVLALPVPGHTKGSVLFLLEERFLFTGDSLYWSRHRAELSAFRDACWYSWEEQARSLARLRGQRFSWVLPGHGNRRREEPAEFARQLDSLVSRMALEKASDW
jgi:glyoxylase-like metal-dependent hydrolase (beta-lactamase superfamily II)/ferredoxin